MFVCAISRLRSLNNAVTMVYPRSISRLRRNQNQISRATSPTFTSLLLMGFNNRINRPVDGRLLNQLKTHLVQPSKTYATTILPTFLSLLGLPCGIVRSAVTSLNCCLSRKLKVRDQRSTFLGRTHRQNPEESTLFAAIIK